LRQTDIEIGARVRVTKFNAPEDRHMDGIEGVSMFPLPGLMVGDRSSYVAGLIVGDESVIKYGLKSEFEFVRPSMNIRVGDLIEVIEPVNDLAEEASSFKP
jgi:hypothetical protein